MKNRFQSLPFKCNLQRYTTGKYPYDLTGGIAGLAFQVVGEPAPAPTPEVGRYKLNSFI